MWSKAVVIGAAAATCNATPGVDAGSATVPASTFAAAGT